MAAVVKQAPMDVQTFNDVAGDGHQLLVDLGVPNCASYGSYNNMWPIRGVIIGAMRMQGVMRLTYDTTDEIESLPGRDQSNHLALIAKVVRSESGDKKISSLYEKFPWIKCPPELITCCACVQKMSQKRGLEDKGQNILVEALHQKVALRTRREQKR